MTELDSHEDLVRELLSLWFSPPPGADELAAGFRKVYTDPVQVNGMSVPVAGLVAQVQGLHTAYDDLVADVSLQVPTADGVALAFEMRGRHVGPLPTPVGTLAATGRTARVPTIELLTIQGGQIAAVQVIADELVLLRELGALPESR